MGLGHLQIRPSFIGLNFKVDYHFFDDFFLVFASCSRNMNVTLGSKAIYCIRKGRDGESYKKLDFAFEVFCASGFGETYLFLINVFKCI